MSEVQETGTRRKLKPNRFRITSIIIAVAMLVGAFGVLIGPFTINVSAVADTHTWDGGGADAFAGTPANWVGDIAPEAGDSVIFDSGALPCTWNLTGTYGSFSMNSGYTGLISQSVAFEVSDMTIASGEFNGAGVAWLTVSGYLTKNTGGIISANALKLKMTGEGKTIAGTSATVTSFSSLWIAANITQTSAINLNVKYDLTIDSGKTFTPVAGKYFDYTAYGSYSNSGTIAGPRFIFQSDSVATYTWTPGVIVAPIVQIYSASGTRTVSLAGPLILTGTLLVDHQVPPANCTLKTNGYAVSTPTLTIGAKGVLVANGQITGNVVMNSGGKLTNDGPAKITGALTVTGGRVNGTTHPFEVTGVVTNGASGFLNQSTGTWTLGSYVQSGISSNFSQHGNVVVTGETNLTAGILRGEYATNYWWYSQGNFTTTNDVQSTTVAGHILINSMNIAMNGTGKVLQAKLSVKSLAFYGNTTVQTISPTAGGYYGGSSYLIVGSGVTVTMEQQITFRAYGSSGNASFSNLGRFFGPGTLYIEMYDQNRTMIFGNVDSPVIISSLTLTNFDLVLTLGADATIGSSLRIVTGNVSRTNTITLDVGVFNLVANGIIIDDYGILNARNSTITSNGHWDSEDGEFTDYASTVIIEGRTEVAFGTPSTMLSNNRYNSPGDSMVKALNGDYLLFNRDATSHVAPGDYGVMKLWRSTDQGITWVGNTTIVSVANKDVRNYAVGVTPSGRIIAFFSQFDTDGYPGGNDIPYHDIHYVYSDDNGITWSANTEFVEPAIGGFIPTGASPYYQITVLNAGRIGTIYEAANTTHSQLRLAYSDDDGATWIHVKVNEATDITVAWLEEASMAYMGDGKIVAWARVYSKSGYEMFTSIDNGLTWTDRGRAVSALPSLTNVLIPFTNSTGASNVLGLSLYGDLYYTVANSTDLITLGINAWPGLTYIGSVYGAYLTAIYQPSQSRWFVSTYSQITGVRADLLSWYIYQDSIVSCKVQNNQPFENLVIDVNGTLDITATASPLNLAKNFTISSISDVSLSNNTYVTNQITNYGSIIQNGNILSISGSSTTPLLGYGLFDGDLYLNGTATNYQIQTGLPMGILHTNRDTSMTIDAVHSLSSIRWTIEASGPAIIITFTLSGLESGRMYRLYVDGSPSTLLTASGSGVVSFTYSGPWSEHQFEIVATSIGGSISGLVNLVFIMFAIGIVVGVVAEGTNSLRKMQMRTTQQMVKSLLNMVIYIVIGIASLGVLYSMVI